MKGKITFTACVGMTLFLVMACGQSMKPYEALKDPSIVQKPSQNMITVEVKGDPSKTGDSVSLLYQAYFKLPIKAKKMVAPRARWPKPFNTPREEWVGIWGLPIPAVVTVVPQLKNQGGNGVRIETWEYGTVAEILHKGPYKTELPTVERLRTFISNQGYVISGPHEEEYLRGPGMFGPGNPEKYYTIIRYPVKKR